MLENLSNSKLFAWLTPLIYLTNNWLSMIGVAVVTTAGVFWLFLLPTTLSGRITHPYIGILVFLCIPAIFFGGLALIPLGIVIRQRRERRRGLYPSHFPPLTWANAAFRRLVIFVSIMTVVNIVMASQLTYGAVNYMDSVTFCGLTCHKVMQPEYTAYQNSPHSRVECVQCHIGPGASWFVRSKLTGVGQVFAVALDTYPRPIPDPVQNLRPARETCEVCHWPQKFDSDVLRIIPSFADDEQNTRAETVLMMKIGGGNRGGIHGMHVGPGVHIRYASDPKRQTIYWVEYGDKNGHKTMYRAPGVTQAQLNNASIREMDCVDCHNRPSHAFELPERAVNQSMASGAIASTLPFAKKESVEILKKSYSSRDQAAQQIPAAFEAYYRSNYPQVYSQHKNEVTRSAQGVLAVYDRNVFPAMKVNWGSYPNNIGHMDFPGCFRCHDGSHTSADGKVVTQDCTVCHNVLAVEETSPKILSELGITSTTVSEPAQ